MERVPAKFWGLGFHSTTIPKDYDKQTHLLRFFHGFNPMKPPKPDQPLSKAMVGSGVCLVLVEFNQNMGESSLVDLTMQRSWKVNFGPHHLKQDQTTYDIGWSCQAQ